jgi:hypothetical protein
MSTYRALKGYSVKSITSDPANTKEGQIWYNDTSNKIKVIENLENLVNLKELELGSNKILKI